MNIEISPKQYWKKLNYYDALLYLSILEIDGKSDWRMFNNSQELLYNTTVSERLENNGYVIMWYNEDIDKFTDEYLKNEFNVYVLPVRDI